MYMIKNLFLLILLLILHHLHNSNIYYYYCHNYYCHYHYCNYCHCSSSCNLWYYAVSVICDLLHSNRYLYYVSKERFLLHFYLLFSSLLYLHCIFYLNTLKLLFLLFSHLFDIFFFPVFLFLLLSHLFYHTLLHFFHNFLIIFIFPLFFSDSHPSSLVCPASRCCCPYQKLVSSFWATG